MLPNFSSLPSVAINLDLSGYAYKKLKKWQAIIKIEFRSIDSFLSL